MRSCSQYKYHAYTHNFLQSTFITDAWWLYFAGETCCMLGIKKTKKYGVIGGLYITFFLSDKMGCLK